MDTLSRQTIALIWRYLITLTRSPIASLGRMLIWPGLIFTACLVLIYKSDFILFTILSRLVLLSTFSHLFHYVNILVSDKASGFRMLMILMGLKRDSYYLANFICLFTGYAIVIWVISTLAIIQIAPAGTCLASALLVALLFPFHLTGYTLALASFISSTTMVGSIVFIILFEFFLYEWVIGSIYTYSNSMLSMLLIVILSISPFNASKMIGDCCYPIQSNIEAGALVDTSFKVNVILSAMAFWSLATVAFARWFDRVCPWQVNEQPQGPLFCFQSNNHRPVSVADAQSVEQPHARGPNFEKSAPNRTVGIRIRNLTKQFDDKTPPAVQSISFDIHSGETTLLLGHNGAGKTTLMNMILGKLTPTSGYVSIGGATSKLATNMGVCPQESVLDENLSVQQHLELFADIKWASSSSWERARHVKATLDDVFLANQASKLPGELSGGMRRKLSLALAFVGESNVLILDEPSSGLDPESRMSVWNAIRRYRIERTVLLSTQHMEEADYLGDRIAIMEGGRIFCCGSSTFLMKTFGHGYKLRVECKASKRLHVVSFIKKYFAEAKVIDGNLNGEPASAHADEASIDMVVELIDSKQQDLELSLIKLLQEIEKNPAAHFINSFGLRSSSVEDIMLGTGGLKHDSRVFSSESGELSVRGKKLTHQLSSITRPHRPVSPIRSQMRCLKALLIKNLHMYRRDWLWVLFVRVALGGTIFTCLGYWGSSSLVTGLMYLPAVAHLVEYPALEQTSKFKAMQMASHCSHFTYWLSYLIMDLLYFAFLSICYNTGFYFRPNLIYLVKAPIVHLILTGAIFLFALSASLLGYVISTLVEQTKFAGTYYILFASFGYLVSKVAMLLGGTEFWLVKFSKYFSIQIIPTDAFHHFVTGLSSKCYISESPKKSCDATLGPRISPVLLGVLCLLGQVIYYSLCLFLLETNLIDPAWYGRARNVSPCCSSAPRTEELQQQTAMVMDEDVLKEAKLATQIINDVPGDAYSLVAANLCKSYIRGEQVINHLSFSVAKGECFGLLGVNGAGKSTTFSIIATETRADRGRVWLSGDYLEGNVRSCRRRLGYDPQTSPAELALSANEALYLMGRLRQMEEASIGPMVACLLELLDMAEHKWKACSELSGGTRRKLALAMSLAGSPSVLVLDEPTAGVDPLARRSVWRLLRWLRGQRGSSILLASHAMEECEAICNRISIMARGRLRCIGTFLHLRSKFAQGFIIRLQFGTESSSPPPSSGKSTNGLAAHVRSTAAQLHEILASACGGHHGAIQETDRNLNSVTYKVSDGSVRRSALLVALRGFKQSHGASNLNYTLNDCSLEDIFIGLAREQRQQ